MSKKIETLVDFVSGRRVPNTGAEENRQQVERYLVDSKGYSKDDILVDEPISFTVEGQAYASCIDLVVKAAGRRFMAIKCAAGSLGSREREAIAAARLADKTPLLLAVVSDGRQATVMETVSGRRLGNKLDDIPSRREAVRMTETGKWPRPLNERQLRKERLIFRSYDSMNVNVARRMEADRPDA